MMRSDVLSRIMTFIQRLAAGALLFFTALVLLTAPLKVSAAARLQDPGEELVVVIDPGHGGENRGADEYGEPIEKDMNLTTALAMREELSKYDGVTVYMTRTEDKDMSLIERAEFAKSVNADFLFSLHYNVSADHKVYGSEVLASKETPYNAYSFQFGEVELSVLSEKGLYSRGIKTKNSGDGGDYYGLLREASDRGIPAVIIEHCHMDVPEEREACDTQGELSAFGVADATAVAKYFGLKSSALGRDYSSYAANELIDADPNHTHFATVDNEDGIDELTLEQIGTDIYTGEVTVKLHGYDSNDAIMYYEYSINGGESWSKLFQWPGANPLNNDNEGDVTVKISLGTGSTNPIVFRAYNMFDAVKESNTITVNWNYDKNNDGILAGDGSVIQETPGQWINDSGLGTEISDISEITEENDTGTVTAEDSGAVSDEAKEAADTKKQSSALVKNNQLTALAVFIIVAPFVTGLMLAGWFLYRHLK